MSPCGYAVDIGRRAYTTKVRFFADSPEETTIRWYAVPRNRPWLPVPTIFGSYDWEEPNFHFNGRNPGVLVQGEQMGDPRTWANGSDPTRTVYTGHYCGTPEQWLGAMALPPVPPVPTDVLLRPLCCNPPVVTVGAGGQLQGGRATMRQVVPRAGVGGQLQGGVAYQSGTIDGSGGQAQGGEAEQGLSAILEGTGGQEQGGESHQGDLPPLDPIVTDATQANGGEWTVIYPTPLWLLAAAEQDQSGDPGE